MSWRQILLGAVMCAATLAYSGYASALPHDHKDGKGGWGWSDSSQEKSFGHGNKWDWGKTKDWDREWKTGKHGWDPNDHKYDHKKDWFSWEHDKWSGGWGKDPDCDPVTPTPEPTTLLLLGTALAGAGAMWRRKSRPGAV